MDITRVGQDVGPRGESGVREADVTAITGEGQKVEKPGVRGTEPGEMT